MTRLTQAPNRLIHEKSPYLCQHAYNPVDWFPWGGEAFAKAEQEDKPVFLSIGYSTCHWCHVMAHETFAHDDAAALLNRNFISVKVDREERPDVDHIYMEACQLLTGSGGWPLSVFLTPAKIPFLAGTYFPRNTFLDLLNHVSGLWKQDRARILQTASEMRRHWQNKAAASPAPALREDIPRLAYEQLSATFDQTFGGFGRAPKFPCPHTLMFLSRYGLLNRQAHAQKMVAATLDSMAKGGIFDQIGGGFCRYATDRQYLIPHFEKMMYDNAMLSLVYAEAGCQDIAVRTLSYCLREMRGANGGFYTAQDADSEGEEGKYYCFTPQEVTNVLGPGAAKIFCKRYDITNDGNFEGKSIPNLLQCQEPEEDPSFWASCRQALYDYRVRRAALLTDQKQLASVNGLMTAALSTAGRLLGQPRYIAEAVKTARFVRDHLFAGDRMHASYLDGLSPHLATSDDYAYVAWGFYRLHQATLDTQWLQAARELADQMLMLFGSPEGSLFLSGSDVDDLPLRGKNTYDGALPSGNAIAAGLFLRLYQITGMAPYEKAYQGILTALTDDMNRFPLGHLGLLSAVMLASTGGIRVEIAGLAGETDLLEAAAGFYPFAAVCKAPDAAHGQAEARVCRQNTCHPPITDPDELKKMMRI